MKCSFLSRQFWRSVRRVCSACVCTVLLCSIGPLLQAAERPDTPEHFVELDSELQAIRQEILEINREILLLRELSLSPQGQQLVVLVSVAAGSAVKPERITLQLDGQTASQHDYSDRESAALLAGGVHRLYAGSLSEGEHTLGLSVSGRQARDKAFRQRRSVTLTKLPARKYVELHLSPGQSRSEPAVTIREWQQ